MTRKCYRCGTKSTGQLCPVCGDDLHEQAREQSAPSTRGFYLRVDDVIVHVLGDPEMEQPTIDALTKLIRAARRKFDGVENSEGGGE